MFKTNPWHHCVRFLLILALGLFSLTALAPATTSTAFAAPTAADAKNDAVEKEAKPDLIDAKPGTYIWQLIVFVIVFSVLAKFVWPVILKGIRDREEKMHNDLTTAENAANEAKATLEQYKQQLQEAHREAQRIIEQSRKDAEQIAAQIKSQAESDILAMKHRAEMDINAAKQQAVNDIFEQATTMATQVAGQILKREINANDHQQLVQASLAELNRN